MTFVSNPNRDKFLFSHSHNIENWYVFIQKHDCVFYEHTWFKIQCVLLFCKRFNFSLTFSEEREKISKTLQF